MLGEKVKDFQRETYTTKNFTMCKIHHLCYHWGLGLCLNLHHKVTPNLKLNPSTPQRLLKMSCLHRYFSNSTESKRSQRKWSWLTQRNKKNRHGCSNWKKMAASFSLLPHFQSQMKGTHIMYQTRAQSNEPKRVQMS